METSNATTIVIAKKTTLRVDASGQVNIDVDGKTTITITPEGDFTVESKGKGTLIAKQWDIDGGGDLEPVHSFPSAISDFTGQPIQQPSSTVKVSK